MIAHDPRATVEALAAELAALDWLGGARIFPGPLLNGLRAALRIQHCPHCHQHGGLALDLAAQSRDLVLVWLLGLALLVMCPQAENSGPRETIAAERWWRVWAHLAAVERAAPDERGALMIEPDRSVPVLGSPFLAPGDRYARIVAYLTESETSDTPICRPLSVSLQSGDTRQRVCRIPPRWVARFLNDVATHAGAAWVRVKWLGTEGEDGWTAPVSTEVFKLPPGRQAARDRVRVKLQDAEAKMRAYLKRPDRRRLEDYAIELTVYLLRHGHGALRRHTEKQTFAVLFGKKYTGDSYKDSPERRALRADYARARRLIAAPPGHPAR